MKTRRRSSAKGVDDKNNPLTNNNDQNQYLEKVRQKREQNKQRLADLGLNDEFKNSLKRNRGTIISPKKKNTSIVKVASSVQPRRSPRKANKTVLYTGEEIDDLESKLSKNKRKSGSNNLDEDGYIRHVVVKRRKIDLKDQISEEKRKLYENIPHEEWLEDMRRFFKENKGNSDNNVQRSMNIVRKLALGLGVQHPSTSDFFKKNVKVKLSDDFREMLDEASEWVQNNGGDKGNGWLIEHPVKKCFVYQQERAERGSAFYKDAKP